MNAYLLTWNPAKYNFSNEGITDLAKRSRSGKTSQFDWSCANSKSIARGDRVFLIKLGKQGRGIFASGWVTRGSYPAPPDSGFGPQYIDGEWDAFLDPRIPASLLDPTGLPGTQHWTPENSGTTINPVSHRSLEQAWAKHLAHLGAPIGARTVFSKQELLASFDIEALEGELVERLVAHRRRERSLRDAKLVQYRLAHGSLACEACSFDFEDEFGVVYAEVHHVLPLAASAGPKVTRLDDLAVLCANCHRVAHLNPKKPKSLRELRNMLGGRP